MNAGHTLSGGAIAADVSDAAARTRTLRARGTGKSTVRAFLQRQHPLDTGIDGSQRRRRKSTDASRQEPLVHSNQLRDVHDRFTREAGAFAGAQTFRMKAEDPERD